jgi:hypothetical protein
VRPQTLGGIPNFPAKQAVLWISKGFIPLS